MGGPRTGPCECFCPHPHFLSLLPTQTWARYLHRGRKILFLTLSYSFSPGHSDTFRAPFLWLGREGSGWAHTPQCPVSLGLGLQYPLAFALSFSRWLCTHPELYRLLVELNSVGPLVPGDLIAKGSLVSS